MSRYRSARLLAACTVLILAWTAAAAADRGFYVGGAIGRAAYDGTEVIPGGDDDPITGVDLGWNAFAGYRLIRHFALEAGWYDLGEGHDHDEDQEAFRAQGTGLAFRFPFRIGNRLSVSGRLGAFYYTFTETGPQDDEEEEGAGFFGGLALEYRFTRGLRAHVEWNLFNDLGEEGLLRPGVADVQGLFAGLSYMF